METKISFFTISEFLETFLTESKISIVFSWLLNFVAHILERAKRLNIFQQTMTGTLEDEIIKLLVFISHNLTKAILFNYCGQ